MARTKRGVADSRAAHHMPWFEEAMTVQVSRQIAICEHRIYDPGNVLVTFASARKAVGGSDDIPLGL